MKTLDKKVANKIEQAFNEIRPYLQEDGGDIKLIDFTDKIVKIKFIGACSHCHISSQTLKNGVEEVVKRYLPQIEEVIDIDAE